MVCWEIILRCSWVYFGVLGCTWVCKKITGSKQELLSLGECFVAGPYQTMPCWSICLTLVKKMTTMIRTLKDNGRGKCRGIFHTWELVLNQFHKSRRPKIELHKRRTRMKIQMSRVFTNWAIWHFLALCGRFSLWPGAECPPFISCLYSIKYLDLKSLTKSNLKLRSLFRRAKEF